MRLVLTAILLLSLASCDTGAYAPAGDAAVEITGAYTADGRWNARFGDGDGITISTDGPVFVSVEPGVERLAPGRYVLGQRRGRGTLYDSLADTLGGGLTVYARDAPTLSFVARSGELVIDAASAREVRGSLSFTATRLALGAGSAQAVDVRARFRAEYVPFCC